MSLPAQFNQTCKVCGTQIKKGDGIYKVNGHWCSDPACGSAAQEGPGARTAERTDAPQAKTGNDAAVATATTATTAAGYAKVHDEAWAFALGRAKGVWPGSDSDSARQRSILAQVFYKKCMDWEIHHHVPF